MELIKDSIYKGTLENGDEYRLKSDQLIVETNLFAVETRITHRSRHVGRIKAYVLNAERLFREPMLHEINLMLQNTGGIDNFKRQVHLTDAERIALITEFKLSENAILSGVAEGVFDNINEYLRSIGNEFNRIVYLNGKLAGEHCRNPKIEAIHFKLLSEHPEFTLVKCEDNTEKLQQNVLNILTNFTVSRYPDKHFKVIVSTIKAPNGCNEIIARLFVNDRLIGFMYAVQGYKSRLAEFEIFEPFKMELQAMDSTTPAFCICRDTFMSSFVKSDIFLSVTKRMLDMMYSICPNADESILVQCGCFDKKNEEVKLCLRKEVEKCWKYTLLWP